MDALALELPEVVVVATNPLVRTALSHLLKGEGVTAQALSSFEAADETAADVIVWDVGSSASRELDGDPPTVALVSSGAQAATAYAAGARGLLLRDTSGATLSAAVRAVASGLVVVDPSLAVNVVPPRERAPMADELTARESEVLSHLSEGISNKEIAQKMHISDHTVKFHVNAILSKLGVTSRTEAVVSAARRGLVIL